MDHCFKSEEGRQQILEMYDRKMDELNLNCTSHELDTSFGRTHVLSTGPEGAPPLVLVHGSNACAPIALECYPKLPSHFHLHAVDIPAQPNRSFGRPLSMKDDSYSRWMNEVLTKLAIKDVTLIGFSLGGLVILKTLIHDPERISKAFISVPAYISNGNPLKALFKVFIPMRRFIKTKDQKYIDQFKTEFFTDEDPFATEFLSTVFEHFTMDFTPVPVINKKEAGAIKTPLHIFAAENDILFPGKKMIKKVRKLFPKHVETTLMEGSKHVPGKEMNELIETYILNGEG